MFRFMVSLTISQLDCQFLEAPKCTFTKITMTHCDPNKLLGRLEKAATTTTGSMLQDHRREEDVTSPPKTLKTSDVGAYCCSHLP